jgi:hypothetical protein
VVADDFLKLEKDCGLIGLTLNRSKCEIIYKSDQSKELFAANRIDIREIPENQAVLLGAPLSGGSNMNESLASKRAELELLARRLPLMPSHDSLFLV